MEEKTLAAGHDSARPEYQLSFQAKVGRLLQGYQRGIYSMREIFPALVYRTPEGHEAELLALIPADLQEPFKQWVAEYPLEGGIQIRDTAEQLSSSVIVALKKALSA